LNREVVQVKVTSNRIILELMELSEDSPEIKLNTISKTEGLVAKVETDGQVIRGVRLENPLTI